MISGLCLNKQQVYSVSFKYLTVNSNSDFYKQGISIPLVGIEL